MKGFVDEIGWTAFFLVAVVFIALIGIIGVVMFNTKAFFSSTPTNAIDFLSANNGPYIISSLLTHNMMGDRQFLEISAEIIASGNLKNAASRDVLAYLNKFISEFKNMKFVSVSIEKQDGDEFEEIVYTDNVPKKCGDSLEGFCVDAYVTRQFHYGDVVSTQYVGCTDGRIQIDDSQYTNSDNRCRNSGELCCIENIDENGIWQSGVPCGGAGTVQDNGICDYAGYCTAGRAQIEDKGDDCGTYITTKGTCCISLTGDILVKKGYAYRAETPLFYKNEEFGKIVVTVI